MQINLQILIFLFPSEYLRFASARNSNEDAESISASVLEGSQASILLPGAPQSSSRLVTYMISSRHHKGIEPLGDPNHYTQAASRRLKGIQNALITQFTLL